MVVLLCPSLQPVPSQLWESVSTLGQMPGLWLLWEGVSNQVLERR